MSFIVEDGTIVLEANSYCDLVTADTYFANRNVSTWTGEDSVKQAALIKATDYIELRFSERFKGVRVSENQPLSWPRILNPTTKASIFPVDIKRACCEYALRALSANLMPDLTYDDSGLPVIVTKKTIAGISKEYKPIGNTTTTPSVVRQYPSADFWLKKWLNSAQGTCFR